MEVPSKRAKLDEDAGEGFTDLAGFSLKKILSNDSQHKRIVVQGRFTGKGDDESDAVVVIEKLPFDGDQVEGCLKESTSLVRQFKNDVYSMYHGSVGKDADNLSKVNVIWPANQKHLDKFSKSPLYVVNETPALYNFVTLPFVESGSQKLDWVWNILEHKSEADRIVYEDYDPETGYIVLPDFKWSTKSMEDLYCIALVHKRGLRSIRDLNASHLPLLKKLLDEAPKAIRAKYGISESKLRIYFHYQPSYYHLHVHYSAIDHRPPGINVEKAHALQSVIANIERDPSFWARTTIPMAVAERTGLFEAYAKVRFDFRTTTETEGSISNGDWGKDSIEGCIKFLRLLGKAKHEPCGEHWSTSYGDGAWRMAVMAICLPAGLDRKRIMEIAISSALTSLGKGTDENSTWAQKLLEVRGVLAELLPLKQAARMYDLFVAHVNARRGTKPSNEEERVYRKLLEMEEALLTREEVQAEDDESTDTKKVLLSKMVEVGFPGHERYTMFRDATDLNNLLEFFIRISSLRRLKRTGWVNSGVRDPERVSGHMFRMAAMGLLLGCEDDRRILDGDAVVLSVVHDVAECVVGDLTPSDPITPEEKHRKEREALESLVRKLPCSMHSREILEAFRRYEEQPDDDAAAQLTKDLDKFDMVLQAYEYEDRKRPEGKGADFLQDFFDSTDGVFRNSTVRHWDELLRAKRRRRLQP